MYPFIPLHDTLSFIWFLFCCFSVISAASVLIRLQPFRQMRHLVGLLCGVMDTQRPRASRTSEFKSVSDEKVSTQSFTEASLSQTSWECVLIKCWIGNLAHTEMFWHVTIHDSCFLKEIIQFLLLSHLALMCMLIVCGAHTVQRITQGIVSMVISDWIGMISMWIEESSCFWSPLCFLTVHTWR